MSEFCGQEQGQALSWRPTDEDVLNCARLCHEINRLVCEINGDDSQLSWNDAPDWQRKSSINGARALLESQRHISERDNHDRWMVDKLLDGWRWGPKKDPAAKIHPCLLPYDELPENERIKDALFVGLCRAFRSAKIEAFRRSASTRSCE